jgi:NADPH-dependent 2,4-dienoyl-CoA reductase/sulfur reductase-like enzyme
VIVGGVAGGASAAMRARRMNERARIIILERDAYVSFANCGLPYFLGGEIKDREKLLVAKPALIAKRFRVDVRTRHEVLSIDRTAKVVTIRDHESGGTYEERYDKLILAPGAAPFVPPIPGVHARGVFAEPEDADRIAAAMPARRAVVVGGGYIGLEVAEQFRRQAWTSPVEMLPQVCRSSTVRWPSRSTASLEFHGVRQPGRGIESVEEKDARRRSPRTAPAPADLVLLGVGVRPNVSFADAGLPLVPAASRPTTGCGRRT